MSKVLSNFYVRLIILCKVYHILVVKSSKFKNLINNKRQFFYSYLKNDNKKTPKKLKTLCNIIT